VYSNRHYNIALTLLPGVGNVSAKSLIAYCGNAEAVFKEKKQAIEKIPGIGSITANTLLKSELVTDALCRAEKEIAFIEKNKITPLFFTDKEYPYRLKQCYDSPMMLYAKGNMQTNADRVISIVGSRKASLYGKKMCEQLVEAFAAYNALIVSGLAYGIDIIAHRTALKTNQPTIGVLAHGLDLVYPAEHSQTAEKMTENGGLLTEFMSHTKMNPDYFPRRNRIVAGMADATLVVEATYKSGALITAELANSYDKEVFAVPGRMDDISSEGCNLLIKANKAMLIQSAEDVVKALGWDVEKKNTPPRQPTLFTHLSPQEETIVKLLKEKESVHIDELCHLSNLSMSQAATLLLNLEFAGTVQSLPGKVYSLNQ
jgi:DNA processing protein